MAVREALLTLLSVEPNYGFRLHIELCERLPHRRKLNVGQTYTTLERALNVGLVERAGVNDENLPMFRLSSAGSAVALAWLTAADDSSFSLDETRDRVFLTLTLGDLLPPEFGDSRRIIERERERLATISKALRAEPSEPAIERWNRALSAASIDAVVNWLGTLSDAPPHSLNRPFNSERPRRGRPKRAPLTAPVTGESDGE
ncbi:MAG: PadR family transcriptional regulator [Microbacteriaceae bacterium]